MGKIEIKDLPKDVKITKEEMKKMRGGGLVSIPSFGTFNSQCSSCGQNCAYFQCQACQSCYGIASQCQDGQACTSCQPLRGLIGENG